MDRLFKEPILVENHLGEQFASKGLLQGLYLIGWMNNQKNTGCVARCLDPDNGEEVAVFCNFSIEGDGRMISVIEE